ncbi:MAG TPA: Mur ligase family protein, partial [Candidatus Saccharimonadales bacterium]|nr:Mur ligase family protein [Candidatus Saccharimonadales bacterium]
MTEVTTFAEAHAALRKYYQVPLNGPYTLDRMYRLLAAVGNPQDTLRAIHIAGTSGKTSTAYYAAALLQQTGAKVGLTVSPHVDEVNERVQLNLTPLPEAQFCAELTEFLALVEASDITPSYFECMIAFAYWEFARQQVDYAVVEVGLGGLLDGTNTIQRDDKVCVIADIGFDHTEVLGDTLEAIAAQKAGIIQPHNAVFVHPQDEAVMAVFQEACHAKVAELTVVPDTLPFDSLYLPSFQRRNLSLALAAVKYVLQRDGRNPLDDGQIETAARTHIPARMETVKSGGRTFILDGAHNAQKLATLFDDVERRFPGQE